MSQTIGDLGRLIVRDMRQIAQAYLDRPVITKIERFRVFVTPPRTPDPVSREVEA